MTPFDTSIDPASDAFRRNRDEMLALVTRTGAALMVVTHSNTVAARMDRQLHLSAGRLA